MSLKRQGKALIVFLATLALSFIVSSSAHAEPQAIAIIIEISGAGCLVNTQNCEDIHKGEYLYDGQKLMVRSGTVTVVDFEEKAWVTLNQGSHTFVSSSTQKSSNRAQNDTILSQLLSPKVRSTATIATRNNDSGSHCAEISKQSYSFNKCSTSENKKSKSTPITELSYNGYPIPQFSTYLELPKSINANRVIDYNLITANQCKVSTDKQLDIPNTLSLQIRSNDMQNPQTWEMITISLPCKDVFLADKNKLDTAFEDKKSQDYLWSRVSLYKKYNLNYDAAKLITEFFH